MNLVGPRRAPRLLRTTGKVLGGLALALLVPIVAAADSPIASSSFVGIEDPLSENGAWTPLTSLWPGTGRLQKNDGAFPDQTGHAGAHTTAAVPADQYSEIVVGHIGDIFNDVGPIVRVQTSGPAIDSHFLWWATQPGGDSNGLYRIDATGTSYTYQKELNTPGVADGDRLRLIARGPVIYGLKNGVRQFIYNPHQASFHYPTGSVGLLAYSGNGVLTNAKIASWSTGAAPVSSGTRASTNFAGTEDPLDEGDRWYPLPSYSGLRKQGGLAIGEGQYHNASGVWSITPPAKQYSQVTLGTVSTGGGGPIVRIDRNANVQTGWMLFLWTYAGQQQLSGIYKLTSDANGEPTFTATKYFPTAPSIVAGDTWRLTADGNTLEVFRNGVSQFTYVTDGSYPSGDVGVDAYTQSFTFSAWEGGATDGGVDTQPPTAPSNLTATATSSSQVTLGWTASTDNVGVTGYLVERCQGTGCTSFAQIATPTSTTYNDVGLTGSTPYSYRIRATDAAGNLSPYSNVASAATPDPPDTTPPTAPSNLTATAASSSTITLAWTASTDNVEVAGYLVERCQGTGCTNFAQVTTAASSPYDDTGLAPNTPYSYRMRATDAAGNLSPYSGVASATTAAPPDTTPPTAPSNLTATAASGSQINLAWTGSTDNVAVTGYLIERCQGSGCTSFAQVGTTSATTYNDTGLTNSTTYRYRVRATDAAGNLSAYSNLASASTDVTPPTAPTALAALGLSSSQISLVWTASTDDVGVAAYVVERCAGALCSNFAPIATVSGTSYTDTGLTAATSYTYRVRAKDAAGNLSPYSNEATALTLLV